MLQVHWNANNSNGIHKLKHLIECVCIFFCCAPPDMSMLYNAIVHILLYSLLQVELVGIHTSLVRFLNSLVFYSFSLMFFGYGYLFSVVLIYANYCTCVWTYSPLTLYLYAFLFSRHLERHLITINYFCTLHC